LSEERAVYQLPIEADNVPSLNGGRQPQPERLPEPLLSHYQALRRQFDAAQIQAATLQQALQAFMLVVQRFYGTGPNDGIDPDGYLQRARPAEGEEDAG
jgi:hypothetical protein